MPEEKGLEGLKPEDVEELQGLGEEEVEQLQSLSPEDADELKGLSPEEIEEIKKPKEEPTILVDKDGVQLTDEDGVSYRNRFLEEQRKHGEADEKLKEFDRYPRRSPAELKAEILAKFTDPLTGEVDYLALSSEMADLKIRERDERNRLTRELKRTLKRSKKDFGDYEGDIDDYLDKISPQAITKEVIEDTYWRAKGRAADKTSAEKVKKAVKRAGENREIVGEIGEPTTPRKTPKVKLSPEMQKAMDRDLADGIFKDRDEALKAYGAK